MADIINLLVVGECGDGKSTLIDNLRDPNKSEQPICGKNARGEQGILDEKHDVVLWFEKVNEVH